MRKLFYKIKNEDGVVIDVVSTFKESEAYKEKGFSSEAALEEIEELAEAFQK